MVSQREIVDDFALKRVSISGDEILCSCPYSANHLHGDVHPSFRLNASKGLYICFGCGERGNLVKLAQDVLGMSRVEALSRYGDSLSDGYVDDALAPHSVAEKAIDVHADDAGWVYGPHPYWASRGFTDETVMKWRLAYDPAENRAVVPIFSGGRMVGWSKRAVVDGVQPKWTHSPGLRKSELLFGMDNFTGDCAVLVEAPLSVIMLDQYGVSNAVASFGCSLSESQSRLLRSRYNSVLVFYDPDPAGFAGTSAAIDMLSDYLDVYVVPPTRDDPAAMTMEEDLSALSHAFPAWAYGLERR